MLQKIRGKNQKNEKKKDQEKNQPPIKNKEWFLGLLKKE